MSATVEFLDLGRKKVARSILPDHYFPKFGRSCARGRVIDCCIVNVCYVRNAKRQSHRANARRVCVGMNGDVAGARPSGLERHVTCPNNIPTVVVRVVEDDDPVQSW